MGRVWAGIPSLPAHCTLCSLLHSHSSVKNYSNLNFKSAQSCIRPDSAEPPSQGSGEGWMLSRGSLSILFACLGFIHLFSHCFFPLCGQPVGGNVFAHCRSTHGELLSEASHLRVSCSPLYNKQIQHISQT